MRFVRRFTPGWVALPWILLIAVLVNAQRPPPLPRSFRELSTEEISSLVNAKDPLKDLDPDDPNSYLSNILIPRPGERARSVGPVTKPDEQRHSPPNQRTLRTTPKFAIISLTR